MLTRPRTSSSTRNRPRGIVYGNEAPTPAGSECSVIWGIRHMRRFSFRRASSDPSTDTFEAAGTGASAWADPMPPATLVPSRPRSQPRLGRATVGIVLVVGLVALVAPQASAHGFNAGAYGPDSSRSGYAMKRHIGFNTVYLGVTLGGIKGTLASLDRLQARGMKAVIWLGSYDRQVHCGFERDDTWIQTVVAGLAGKLCDRRLSARRRGERSQDRRLRGRPCCDEGADGPDQVDRPIGTHVRDARDVR